MTDQDNENTQQDNQLPILYKNITPLLTDLHKDLKMTANQNFEFAAKANVVPITMQELPMAAKHYPIVFAGDKTGIMLAVLGVKTGDNLFVDKDFNWRSNTYIPAYIRRYPFFTARRDEKSEPIICIDTTSSFLSTDGGKELFQDGKTTELLNGIVEFTRNYQYHIEMSGLYGVELEKLGLLEDQQVSFHVGEEVRASVNGFRAINRSKFDEINGDTLKEWLGKGWLDASILHLSSGGNFDQLWRMEKDLNK